jgi:hypothetical protein
MGRVIPEPVIHLGLDIEDNNLINDGESASVHSGIIENDLEEALPAFGNLINLDEPPVNLNGFPILPNIQP